MAAVRHSVDRDCAPAAAKPVLVHEVFEGTTVASCQSSGQNFSLGSYVQLVDYTGRLFRQGKASISAELAGIFERLGCSAQSWQNRMEKLRDGRLLGRFFATTRAKLREIAERHGMRRPVNVAGYPVR